MVGVEKPVFTTTLPPNLPQCFLQTHYDVIFEFSFKFIEVWLKSLIWRGFNLKSEILWARNAFNYSNKSIHHT